MHTLDMSERIKRMDDFSMKHSATQQNLIIQGTNRAIKLSKTQAMHQSISVKNIVDSVQNIDHNFGVKGYPNKNHVPITVFDKTKDVFLMKQHKAKEKNYLATYIHQHSNDPGPKYDIQLNMTKTSPTLNNTYKPKISSSKIPSTFDTIVKQAKETPGAGAYNTARVGRQHKIEGNYTTRARKNAYIEEIQYRSSQSPGASHYKNVAFERYKPKIQ